MIVFVPLNGELYAPFQVVIGMIAQLIHRRLNVATPVALFQYMVFIVVESGNLSRNPTDTFSKERYDTQHPNRGFDANPPRFAQLLVNIVAKCR